MFNDCSKNLTMCFFLNELSMRMGRGDTMALVNASQLED